MPNPPRSASKSHVPQGSILFDKVVPAAFVVLGFVTLVLILFAVGVLLGLIRF